MRDEKNPTEFGAWLLPRLKTRQINREQFAKLCGVGSSVVAKWIFVSRPSAASCQLVADALHLDVSEVLEAAGYPVGHMQRPTGDLRAEITRLVEVIPEPLLLPYAIGMRAIAGHSEPGALMEELETLLRRSEDGGEGT